MSSEKSSKSVVLHPGKENPLRNPAKKADEQTKTTENGKSLVAIRNPLSNLPDNFAVFRLSARPNQKLPLKAETATSKSGTVRNNSHNQKAALQGRPRSKSTSTVEKASKSSLVGNKRKIDEVTEAEDDSSSAKEAKLDGECIKNSDKVTRRNHEEHNEDEDLNGEVFVDAREFFTLPQANREEKSSGLDEAQLSLSKQQTVQTFPIARAVPSEIRPQEAPQARKQKTKLVRKLSNRYNRTNVEIFFANCLYNSDFMTDNYKYMLKAEDAFVLRRSRLAHVDVNKRIVVVNWMIYAQQCFSLVDSTLLLSVRIFDQILSTVKVEANLFLLVAATSLWIANKYADTQHITVSKIFALCDGRFTRRQILYMEKKILRLINFELNIVEPQGFLFYYMRNENLHTNMRLFYASEFTLECFALLVEYSSTHPSLLACCALYLSMVKLQIDHDRFLKFIDSHLLDRATLKEFAGKLQAMVGAVLECTIACDQLLKKYSTLETLNIANEFLSFNV